ncbi:MAG: DEAD/DEAH box helicase [Methylococcales bacterium]|nr:DEAD/DEAH box helicase [Methylococcales bacterium]
MTTIQQRLSELFDVLPQHEQDILLVLAVIYAPIGPLNLQNTLKIAGIDPVTIKSVNRDFQERFQKMGFIVGTHDGWYCHRDISETLMRIAITKPWFMKLAQQLIMEKDGFSYSPAKFMVLHQMKKLRLFLYQHNETGFAANIALLYQDFPEHFSELIHQLFFEHFNREWFTELPTKIRFLVLHYSLIDSFVAFDVKKNSLYNLLEQSFGQSKPDDLEVIHTILEQRLFRGNEKGAVEWLQDDNSADGIKLRAMLAILHNRYDDALEFFNIALKLVRKGNKRHATLGGLYDFFYGLMLFRSRTLTNLQQLRQHLAIFYNKNRTISPLNRMLLNALDIYQDNEPIESSTLLTKQHSAYENLAQILLLHWLDETARISGAAQQVIFLAPLANYCQAAQEANHVWYAAMSSALLQRFGYPHKTCDKIAKYYNTVPFLQLIDAFPRTSAWERALDALSQVNTLPTTVAASVAPSELRMIWTLRLDNGGIALEPKEQRMSKNGSWSKGRAVALKRLHSELNSFDYLTEQDQRICKKIRLSKNDDYYNYYNNETYVMPESALFEAVGHPNVYWASQVQYNTPIDIGTAAPQLLVQEQDDKLHLSLIPQISRDAQMVIQKTATGILLYDINEQHRQVAAILGENGLTIPASARQRVMDSISAVASMLTVQSNMVGMATQAEYVDVDSRLHLHLQPIGQGIQMEVFVQPFFDGGPLYKPATGGTTVLADIDGKQLQTTRDFEIEKQHIVELLDGCPDLPPENSLKWSLEDPDIALETLLNLQNLGEFAVLEWPKGKKIKLSREMGLSQARFSVRHEQNWFSVEGDIQVDDGQVLDMQRLMQLLANSSGRFLQLEDGQIIALTKELRHRLDELAGLGEVKNDKIQFHALAAQALEEITEGMTITASKPWKDQLKRLDALDDLSPKVPTTLQGELRDYQLEGFQWMSRLAHWGAGACLADDMGLGKTVQSLALILSRAPQGPTLILAPTSVCINWLEECARFAPTLNAQQFGTGDRQTMLDNLGAFDLVVCSYGLLQNEGERLQQVQWHTLIADEAQAIKNNLTKRSKAAMALQADFKMVTTGTPIENHLGELWNLFNFINPGLLGSLAKFNERYASAIENNHDHNAQHRLKKLLRPFILRRLKNDVLTELPARTEVTLHIELSADERAMYEALRRSAMQVMEKATAQSGQQLQVLAEIMKLRRACCHPRLVMDESTISSSKLQAFEELVDELLDNRHKALVFSQFVGHLKLIRELLDSKGITYHYLDGSTPVAQRKRAMNAFQAGDGDLFLISLKAGGTGLNLTAADYVIHMDPWWNPAVEDQASDRAHRMGQKRPVTIYRLVAKDTIEDKIVALHHQKRDLANSLLEGGELSGKMSVDAMLELLRDVDL